MSAATVRVAILSFAHLHAVSYSQAFSSMEGVELAGIWDEDAARGAQYAGQFGVPFIPRVETLLDDPHVDAVAICSSNLNHRDLVCAAAQAGKHVLCEKPIATTLADAQSMITACAEAGVLLQIPFVSRFYPMVQTARKMVQAGELGRVIGVVGGNRGVPPLPPYYPEWITDPVQAGGGAVLDHSVHVTDAMRFILGDEAETVFAEMGTFAEKPLAVEDCGLLSLCFQGGAVATVDPSWSIPQNNSFHYDFYLRILGEKGTLVLDDTRQALMIVSDRVENLRPVASEPFGVDVDRAMAQHFIACVRAGENRFPAAMGEDGLAALSIALGAYASAKTHQPVLLRH
jgi:predicted dehydrogenase